MLFVCSFLFFISRLAATQNTITPGQSMRDNETLISADGSFELGFFSPGNARSRYLGVWYKKVSSRTIVWVANKETPILTKSGALRLDNKGNLILRNGKDGVVWSSNNTSRTQQNPVAKLLDSGNLIVRDGKDNMLWQSFDYPSDTMLPGMKLGRNLATGLNWFLTTWKNSNNPAPGEFSFWIDPRGFPQLVITSRTAIRFRLGSWNGLQFTGTPQVRQNPLYNFQFVSNQHEIYYTYELQNNSVASRVVLNETGILQRYVWIDRTQIWNLFFTVPIDQCDSYAFCGANAICNIGSYPVCACLEGFVPKSPSDWKQADWLDGCVRRTKLDCHSGDGFWKLTGLKLPDTSSSMVNESLSLKECKALCLRNCSCVACANSDARGVGSGCLLWFDKLTDIRHFVEGGQDLYIRMAASELGMRNHDDMKDYDKDSAMEEMELPIFDLVIVKNATNNFSRNNKLGEGGFGPVFKGTLLDGQEIAVKRLSETSRQGREEFKNEVKLIAKLQHRNLVKLLGCCIEGEEKLLIYEYMPNKSLDFFTFDKTRCKLLDWHRRFHIIEGIARGLLYLHQDSRLRIIHRDLKVSNILLDSDMNPKISDFGLARTFGREQSPTNTNRVVGTYGYMPPEYAIDGLFSVKSDVFSFGVIILEIVSGKRNRGFSLGGLGHNLLGYAWRLWVKGRPLELIDNSLYDSCGPSQVLRCIQVGLLCVQQLPEDRPNMSTVVLMLVSDTFLPQPKQPGFYTERNPYEAESSSRKESNYSGNEITTTIIDPR
ncbi:G-type lectin S-receptor-like serine/threonine-protein kinase At4g27290 isoform X2 [Hevea brasiliensis]|uniref:G-type lectin S-receptor-like serine/threonine-protein kinase At4g27290 isoform X2 n=1 Tax=Hevea brasiliensis TaxID=3981 RepID=UPI0025FC42A2|nr:G-type lectin S-receptor-like serine/threonine-protein kinase At4g27290 isoform X2 [Hevea brasiliensis]